MPLARAGRIVRNIAAAGLSIYDPVVVGDPNLWLPAPELEASLNVALRGLDLKYPQRTRSKVVKTAVCEALGYCPPETFTKTQPRFPGQNFDTYVQKSANLQVWNEKLAPSRRYVIIKVNEHDVVVKVKVVDGDRLAELDTTGTLTRKYQARYVPRAKALELLSSSDTPAMARIIGRSRTLPIGARSTDYPRAGTLWSIAVLFAKISELMGCAFPDRGSTQERNRGGDLHRMVCDVLGYQDFDDDGTWPDVKDQLLEVKLQTAATIDLGLVCPNSTAPIDVPMVDGTQITHADVRYAVVGAVTNGHWVTITNVYLVTGATFFDFFPQFGGMEINRKLQIRLPRSFFD